MKFYGILTKFCMEKDCEYIDIPVWWLSLTITDVDRYEDEGYRREKKKENKKKMVSFTTYTNVPKSLKYLSVYFVCCHWIHQDFKINKMEKCTHICNMIYKYNTFCTKTFNTL